VSAVPPDPPDPPDASEPPERPADARVRALLGEVGSAPAPAPSTELAVRVVRAARWQRPVRAALDVVASVGGAVAAAASLLFGRRKDPTR